MFDNRFDPITHKGWFSWNPSGGLGCASARTKRNRTSSVEIDIPCCGASNRRSAAAMEYTFEDVYRDGDLIIDSCGLRRVAFTDASKAHQSHGSSMDPEDDTLSVASTQAGESGSFKIGFDDPCIKPDELSSHNIDAVFTSLSMHQQCAHRPHAHCSHDPSAPSQRSAGMRLDTLEKQGILGRGSSGTVYRAFDRSSKKVWAIKEIARPADEEKHRMTIDELRTAYGMQHPCIVGCHEVFYARGVFSLVLEHMDGGSLLDALKAAGPRHPMPLPAIAHVARAVAAALAYLHEDLEVVHRDVKPGNILLSAHGGVKLGDMGICTRPGEVTADVAAAAGAAAAVPSSSGTSATAWIGTVTYMSPERLLGEEYSFAADLWSLGVVIAECALGRYPYALSAAAPRSLQFWDLLDLVLAGPEPAEACRAEWEARAGAGGGGDELGALVRACLERDCRLRTTARAVLAHPLLAAHAGNLQGGEKEEGCGALALWGAQAAAERAPPAAAAAAGQGGVERLQQRLEEGFEGLLRMFSRPPSL